MAIIDHFWLVKYGYLYGQYRCLFEEQPKCRSAVKTVHRNVSPTRNGGQNNIGTKEMCISFVF